VLVTIARAAKIGSFIGPLLAGALELDIAVGENSRGRHERSGDERPPGEFSFEICMTIFYASIIASVELTNR
jgi:hypothetical protein